VNDDEAIELLRNLLLRLMEAQRSGASHVEIERADAFNVVGLAFKYMEVVAFARHGQTPALEVAGVMLVHSAGQARGDGT
jgi:hypothetical protein